MSRWRLFVAVAAVALVGAACGGSGGGGAEAQGDGSGGGSARSGDQVSDPDEQVMSEGGGAASSSAMCVEIYTPETLAKRDFAFDGTVREIKPGAGATQGEEPVDHGPDVVVFEVHTWFKGGSGDTASVQAYAWNMPSSLGEVGGDVGTRLLVSGDDDFAWSCGFTQEHTAEMAAEWKAATS